jgi:hypothetical protein
MKHCNDLMTSVTAGEYEPVKQTRVHNIPLDLVVAQPNGNSLLFYLIKEQRWKLLFNILGNHSLNESNLGILKGTRTTIQKSVHPCQDISLPDDKTLSPSPNTSSVEKIFFDKTFMRYCLFPHLPLIDQGKLLQVNHRLSNYCPEINTLRTEFPLLFDNLLKSGKPINAVFELAQAREKAYCDRAVGLGPLFSAVAAEDLSSLIQAVQSLPHTTPPRWLTTKRHGDSLDLISYAYQRDNLAILLYLFSFGVTGSFLENACRYGSLSLIQLVLLADPTHQLIDPTQCLVFACSQGFTHIVDTLAPLLSTESLSEYLDLAIRIPNALAMTKIFLKHGAAFRLETIKTFGIELESAFSYACKKNLPELVELFERHCTTESVIRLNP